MNFSLARTFSQVTPCLKGLLVLDAEEDAVPKLVTAVFKALREPTLVLLG
eukprot:m.522240 g.522240  ORF g.522240 m.522240 type:complete len:50 (-) comp57514_c0_seq2:683-832(-)